MSSAHYEIVPHTRFGSLSEQIYDLAALAFGAYPGVLRPSRAHRAWYVRRPGMEPEICRAALAGDRLVSNLFVTVARLRLGDGLQQVGIVDTVMTHPQHRRRGLARRLLGEAVAAMRSRGLHASLLYTLQDSMPFRFYRSLGYRPYAPVRCWRRPKRAACDTRLRPLLPGEDGSVRALLNAAYARHEGYVPLDGPLWRWHKVDRPEELGVTVWVLAGDSGLQGTVTTCHAPIITEEGDAAACVLTDVAPAPGSDHASAVIRHLLRAAPADVEARALAARGDRALESALAEEGFRPEATEVAMVLPLSAPASDVAARPPRHWYPLVESIVGL